MPVGYLQARKGVRLQGPIAATGFPTVAAIVVAGNGGGQILFQQSTFAAQIGTRTFRIKRIKGLNQAGVNTLVHIGVGAAGAIVDVMPGLWTFSGLNFDFVEADLPEVEVNADLMVWAVAVPVDVQCEVEELG